MNITEIKIRATYAEGRMKALVSITIDSMLAIHDIKVIEGPDRFFVAMPSRKEENSTFRDIVHPISSEARNLLESSILGAYFEHVESMGKNNSSNFSYNDLDDLEHDLDGFNNDIDDDNDIDE